MSMRINRRLAARMVATSGALAVVATMTVAVAPMGYATVSTINFSAITTGAVQEDVLFGGDAAFFTDSANPSPVASDYDGTFDWGDGTVFSTADGNAHITCANGSCVLSVDGHSYADEGVMTVTARVYPAADDPTSAAAASDSGTLTVGESDSFSGTGVAVSGPANVSLSDVQTASFIDTDTASAAGEFTATIDWGDGTPLSSATIAGSDGNFAVSGSHTYTATGGFTVTTTITDPSPGTATDSVTSNAVIGAQAISFTAPASGTVGGTAALIATGGGSGNPVEFSVDTANTTNAACTVSGPHGASVSYVHAGNCVIDANESGNADYTPAPQVTKTITVDKAAPTVTLNAAPAGGSTIGASVTLTAAVLGVGSGAAPTGTVSFTVGGAAISGCTDVVVAAGSASCTTSDLPVAADALAAAYSGDDDYTTVDATLTYPVNLIATTVTVKSVTNPSVFGQGVSFTATVSPAATGDVQWLLDGNAAGAPVPVSGGAAQFGPISGMGAGSHVVTAQYSGDATHAAASGALTEVVGKAATTTTVSVKPDQLVATVAPVAPGAGAPSGVVGFMVGTTTVGTAPVGADGVSALAYSSVAAETVSATYSGDASFTGSSGSTATSSPAITALVSSAHRKTAFGWYRSPVRVTFTCTAGSAPLSPPGCPAPVNLSSNGAAQSVVRTIQATDGGVAGVTVSPINIDRRAPSVRVKGVHRGTVYEAPHPLHIHCVAHDRLSGLAAPCHVSVHRHGRHARFTAVARDRAGNVGRTTGRYRALNYFLAKARYSHGRFITMAGRDYTVEAHIPAAHPPVLEQRVAPGRGPYDATSAMKRIGHHLWGGQVVISRPVHGKRSSIAVKVGHHTHVIPIVVRG